MEAPTDVQKLIEQVQLLLVENAALKCRLAVLPVLEAENAALKARVGELLNSSNSGKPPVTD